MNAIELLETQHGDIDELFARLAQASGGPQQRLRWFDDLADLLAIHASIEELHFYPSVKSLGTEEILQHSTQEHLGIKRTLSACLAAPMDGKVFKSQLQSLQREVQHHVGEERAELFPLVRRRMEPDLLEALGQEMTSSMAELQKGRPRFDVPLQTLAPMPLHELPMQGAISSRLMPRLSRLVALPLQVVGVAERARALAGGFVHGLKRGLASRRKREA
jgi:hemerythrin HHE cation binding domain-containing protein